MSNLKALIGCNEFEEVKLTCKQ